MNSLPLNSPMPAFPPKARVPFICVLLAVATFALFWPVTGFDFLVYDDEGYVTKNTQVVNGLTAENAAWAFQTLERANWHPLTWLSYMLDCQLFGLSPGRFHLVNLCFHAANAVLLFWVFKRMTGALWQSAFVAALFAWHPLHVESVAWIAERKDVLSAFFGLLTLLAYGWHLNRPNPGRYLLALALFALGLMAKPMLVTLPLVLLLLDFWPLRRVPGSTTPMVAVAKLIWEKFPFFLLAAASSFITLLAQKRGGAITEMAELPISLRLANTLHSYASYIGKMLWPSHLALPYLYPNEFPLAPEIGAGLFLALVSFAVVRQRRTRPYLLTGWLWYVVTLVPVIGLVQVGLQSMADRYTYVPLIGLFVMVSWGVGEWASTWRYRAPLLIPLSATVLLACLTATRVQLQYWKDSEVLFEHTLKVAPENEVAHHNLGGFLLEQGKVDQAIEHFSKALAIGPVFGGTHHDLGLALMKKGRGQEAIEHFRAAVQLKPDSAEFQRQLGVALATQGRSQEAEAQFVGALRQHPKDAELHCELGITLLQRGAPAEAINHFHEALRLNPKLGTALNNLAWVLATCPEAKLRNGPQAVALAERACELTRQREAAFLGTLAAAYAEAGQFPKAIKTAEKARERALSKGEKELADTNQRLLELYRSGRAYREEVRN